MIRVLRLYHIPGRGQTEVTLLGILMNPSMFGGGGSPNPVYYLCRNDYKVYRLSRRYQCSNSLLVRQINNCSKVAATRRLQSRE